MERTKLVPKKQKLRKRVSVIVPCSHKHTGILPELLKHLSAQTRKADEIIISISGCAAITSPTAGVRILHNAAPLTCGQNRNRASAAAVGDVLVYQDADDLPHPQRLAIIAGLFEAYEIEHLLHHYFYKKGAQRAFTLEEAVQHSEYRAVPKLASTPGLGTGRGVTNGNPAILRSVFKILQWPSSFGRGTDVEFNRAVYAHFTRTVVTSLPLITYRHQLSSYR